MLAGPGSISLLIAFYQEHNSVNDILYSSLAILAVSFVIFIILRSADYIAKFLGASGIVRRVQNYRILNYFHWYSIHHQFRIKHTLEEYNTIPSKKVPKKLGLFFDIILFSRQKDFRHHTSGTTSTTRFNGI